MKRRMKTVVFLLLLLLPLFGCGGDGFDNESGVPLELILTVESVGADSISLGITATFGGSTYLWRDGGILADIPITYGQKALYTDHQIEHGHRYCYYSGGYFLLLGEIWSNMECVNF